MKVWKHTKKRQTLLNQRLSLFNGTFFMQYFIQNGQTFDEAVFLLVQRFCTWNKIEYIPNYYRSISVYYNPQ